MYVCMYVQYVCVYVCMFVCMYVCVYVCAVCMYVMCVCMCVCVFIMCLHVLNVTVEEDSGAGVCGYAASVPPTLPACWTWTCWETEC